jgi:hypothetical protein
MQQLEQQEQEAAEQPGSRQQASRATRRPERPERQGNQATRTAEQQVTEQAARVKQWHYRNIKNTVDQYSQCRMQA